MEGDLNMFRRIRCVEIEVHGFCNRKCPWCPNYILNRDKPVEMPEEEYLKILYELKENNFHGTISFSRYNEPMAKITLLKKRVEQAAVILHDIRFVSNTNGDYFNEENLKGLMLDEISIMDYDCIGQERCLDRLNSANAQIEQINYPYIYARYKNMRILYFVDWPVNSLMVDRGGFFNSPIRPETQHIKWLNDRKSREKPCYEPKYFIGIDHTGDVTPCCQIRGDNPSHYKFILGNIHNNTLTKIYFDEKAIDFRETIAGVDCGSYPYPCKYCQKNPGRYTRENPGIHFQEVY